MIHHYYTISLQHILQSLNNASVTNSYNQLILNAHFNRELKKKDSANQEAAKKAVESAKQKELEEPQKKQDTQKVEQNVIELEDDEIEEEEEEEEEQADNNILYFELNSSQVQLVTICVCFV